MQCATAPPLYKKNEQEASLLKDIRNSAPILLMPPARRRKLTQEDLVNAAILAQPHLERALVDAFLKGWEFVPGQLGSDGLPLLGQLPRPISGDRHG